jgi:hypothetical protein
MEGRGVNETDRQSRMSASQVRAVGSPLPVGGGPRGALNLEQEEAQHAAPAPGRSLPSPAGSSQNASGLMRTLNAIKMAMPFLQKIVPMLDASVVTTVSSLLTQPHGPSAPPANLARIETGISELETAHHQLREQVNEQSNTLHRVEDQLDMVREATDRNTLEQQELIEDLKVVGNRVNVLAMVLLSLLVISVLINIGLFLHIHRVLP